MSTNFLEKERLNVFQGILANKFLEGWWSLDVENPVFLDLVEDNLVVLEDLTSVLDLLDMMKEVKN